MYSKYGMGIGSIGSSGIGIMTMMVGAIATVMYYTTVTKQEIGHDDYEDNMEITGVRMDDVITDLSI